MSLEIVMKYSAMKLQYFSPSTEEQVFYYNHADYLQLRLGLKSTNNSEPSHPRE